MKKIKFKTIKSFLILCAMHLGLAFEVSAQTAEICLSCNMPEVGFNSSVRAIDSNVKISTIETLLHLARGCLEKGLSIKQATTIFPSDIDMQCVKDGRLYKCKAPNAKCLSVADKNIPIIMPFSGSYDELPDKSKLSSSIKPNVTTSPGRNNIWKGQCTIEDKVTIVKHECEKSSYGGYSCKALFHCAGTNNQPLPVTKPKTQKYASIIIDADTQEILHARQIDSERYPASLTKVMTLHLVFDALENGTLSLDEKVLVSDTITRTPPIKLGLKPGQSITIKELIQSVAISSHNDSAVVLAEHLGGTEAQFTDMMTAKAKSLGMQKSTFKTANGLPHVNQVTTARDMAKLAYSILTKHNDQYHYFTQSHFRGKENINWFLNNMPEVDGLATGYTNASGYNAMLSATRNGRRQITIILGGESKKSAISHAQNLVDRGFDVMASSNEHESAISQSENDEVKDTHISTENLSDSDYQKLLNEVNNIQEYKSQDNSIPSENNSTVDLFQIGSCKGGNYVFKTKTSNIQGVREESITAVTLDKARQDKSVTTMSGDYTNNCYYKYTVDSSDFLDWNSELSQSDSEYGIVRDQQVSILFFKSKDDIRAFKRKNSSPNYYWDDLETACKKATNILDRDDIQRIFKENYRKFCIN